MGLKVNRSYEKDGDWVEWAEDNGIIIISAHSANNKYSIGMLREMIRIFNKKGELYTELRYNYLVSFYDKHYKLTHLGNNYYKLSRKEK
jgi:hypothetical protein